MRTYAVRFAGVILSLGSCLIFSSCSLSGKIVSINQAASASEFQLAVIDKTVPEHGIATINVTLSKALNSNLSFTYYTQDQTATSGIDYVGISGSTSILAGETQAIISVPINNNKLKAPNKSFYFNISSATMAEISKSSSLVQILDDDYGPISGITKMAAGGAYNHTCALTSAGGIKCWGSGSNGQLGLGTQDSSNLPFDVSGLTSGVSSIAVGAYHTCAVTTSGGAKCWGDNQTNQIGDGTLLMRLSPVDVTGLTSGVAAISGGYGHTCVLTTTGGVRCWGANGYGQLGDSSTTQRTTAVNVTGLASGVASISVGVNHTCAVTTSGGAKCWGRNSFAQLGDGTTTQRNSPVDVSGLTSGVAAVGSGDYHGCALTTTGGVKCWGAGFNGQVGNGLTTGSATAVDVTGLTSGVAAIAVGTNHNCALTTLGGIKCWGSNGYGQVGDETFVNKLVPVDVTGLTSGVVSISAGSGHTCAALSSGQVKCWGDNNFGALGDGTSGTRTVANDVKNSSNMSSLISAGTWHVCAVTTSGGAKCWGSVVGNGIAGQAYEPTDVLGLTSGVVSVGSGQNSSCALTTTGGVKCWGGNTSGQIGDGTTTTRNAPVDVTGLTTGVSAIALGSYHGCALTTAGGIKCWGGNTSGQIGDGTTTQRNTAVDVTGLTSGVSKILAGGSSTCAFLNTGALKCWGYNGFGQIGDGTTTNRSTPVDVTLVNASTISSLSMGPNYNCILTKSASVKCWGNNVSGQLGDGTTANKMSPVDVLGLSSGVTAISTGENNACAITSEDGVRCWGDNSSAQLGNGSLVSSSVPVSVSAMNSGVSSIAIGTYHLCATIKTGGVKCWGSGGTGQLGIGNLSLSIPTDVVSP